MAEAKQELQLQQQRSSNPPPRPCPRPSKNKERPRLPSKPSRLQKRAPPTIQVTSPMAMALRCAEEGWKVAIPLLSPLILSPASPRDEDEDLTTGESMSTSNEDRQIELNPVFMTWQHPAAPFYYDSPAPSSVTPPFVHQCR